MFNLIPHYGQSLSESSFLVATIVITLGSDVILQGLHLFEKRAGFNPSSVNVRISRVKTMSLIYGRHGLLEVVGGLIQPRETKICSGICLFCFQRGQELGFGFVNLS